jgi:hypothetical protein
MATRWDEPRGGEEPVAAGALATEILARADRDVTFIVHVVGESQNLLVRHFVVFIENELATRGIRYGAHPLSRPFIETHARELTDFVLQGIGLRHQFGLQALETMAGDPARLLRVDLWDSLQSHINDAQHNFVSGIGGLQRILVQIETDA